MTNCRQEHHENGRMELDWRKGINCYFDVDGITIWFWGSSWSGMEEVRVDGALASAKRVLRRSSSHTFSVKGIDYEIRLVCNSLMTSAFTITLLRNGVEVDSDEGSYYRGELTGEDLTWRTALKRVGPVFLLSGLAGMAVGYTLAKLLL